MATPIDPSIFPAIDPAAPDGAWRRIALLVLASLLVCAIGGWLGYKQHASPQATASGDLAPPLVTRSASPAFDGLNRGLDENEEFVVDAARPARSSGLSWPMWEFRLRQPVPPRDPSLTPPTWRLIGSALSEGKWNVIVLRQASTTPEYFTVGQELPGGYRIESINDEDVTLAQGKRLMVLSYIGSR